MVENYTKDLKENIIMVQLLASSHWLHNAWKNVSKDEPSIFRKV